MKYWPLILGIVTGIIGFIGTMIDPRDATSEIFGPNPSSNEIIIGIIIFTICFTLIGVIIGWLIEFLRHMYHTKKVYIVSRVLIIVFILGLFLSMIVSSPSNLVSKWISIILVLIIFPLTIILSLIAILKEDSRKLDRALLVILTLSLPVILLIPNVKFLFYNLIFLLLLTPSLILGIINALTILLAQEYSKKRKIAIIILTIITFLITLIPLGFLVVLSNAKF
ncbi:MAG: hypothetical protein KKF56_03870 [Nanoarchaeota archaeon]|nr:hypothetical protein [Nanoarchaeota archaeon]